MTDSPSGRALVTGGGRGIGLATCRALLDGGWEVVAVSRSVGDLDDARRSVDDARFSTRSLDVRDADAVDALVDEIAADGRLRGVVAAHGVYPDAVDSADTELAAFQEVIDINLTGAFVVARAAMRAWRDVDGGRAIVLVGSANGHAAERGQAAYNASKAAVHSLAQTLAVEGGRRVRAVAIAPGWVRTRMVEASITPEIEAGAVRYNAQARVAEPAEIGRLAAWLLSDAASFVTGCTVTVDGGQTAEAPGPWGPA